MQHHTPIIVLYLSISIALLTAWVFQKRSRPQKLTLCRSLHVKALQATVSEGLAQGPYVAGFKPATIRSKGIDSTNAPPPPQSYKHSPIDFFQAFCHFVFETTFWDFVFWTTTLVLDNLVVSIGDCQSRGRRFKFAPLSSSLEEALYKCSVWMNEWMKFFLAYILRNNEYADRHLLIGR